MENKFPEVKAQFPILKVCELLGLNLKPESGGKTYRGQCPFCQSERTFRVTPEKNMYGCFKCRDSGATDYWGDQLNLIERLKGFKGSKEAAEWLLGGVGGTVKKEPATSGAMEPLTYLKHDHPDVELLGFDPEVAELAGVGFAPTGTMKGNVVIPLRLDDGFLIGYVGVQDVTLPKEWHLPDPKVVRFPKKVS